MLDADWAIRALDGHPQATALCYDYTVLTFYAEHFGRVPDLKLYPLR